MEKIVRFISQNDIAFIFGILVVFGLIEGILGFLTNSKRRKDDVLIEIISFVFLAGLSKPLLSFLTFEALSTFLPDFKGAWTGLPFGVSLLIFLFVDDLGQYWYHRLAHEHKWLWKWHRAHHTTTEMGLLVSYRQAVYYYFLIPNVYWMGVFIFLGGGAAAGVGVVLKQLIIISSHSLVTWDSFFYKRPAFMPILRVLERIFVTPAFHHAHHGVSIQDGIGNPNGNFGNMFSIWDQVFRTAKFTHAFPTEYGLPNDPQDNWVSQTFYPLVKSDKPDSELSKDFKFEKTTVNEPAVLTLAKGDYLYCQCGFSKNQPFCDGSHHGTKFQPMLFTIKKERDYKLCQCKMCEKGPFCDNTHLKMQ